MKNLRINWVVLLLVFFFAQPHVNAQWDVNGNFLINPGILGSNHNFTSMHNPGKLLETT